MLALKARHYFLIQLILVTIVFGWAVWDPYFSSSISAARSLVMAVAKHHWDAVPNTIASASLRPRFSGLVLIGGLVLGSTFAMIRNWHSGEGRARGIGSLMTLVTVAALWCGMVTQYSSVCWQGKRWRVSRDLYQVETLATQLRQSWPTEDGESALLGPYMAYPFGSPTTLILLTPPSVARTPIRVVAVERSEAGAIRLQLGGIDEGDWLEWHPVGSDPKSFTAGLGGFHELRADANLADGWHLTRYKLP